MVRVTVNFKVRFELGLELSAWVRVSFVVGISVKVANWVTVISTPNHWINKSSVYRTLDIHDLQINLD